MRIIQFLAGALVCVALAFQFLSGKGEQLSDVLLTSNENAQSHQSRVLLDTNISVENAVEDTSLFADAFRGQTELLRGLDKSDFVLSATTGNLVRLRKGFSGISSLTYTPGDDWRPITDVIAQVVPFTGDETIHFDRLSYAKGEKRPVYEFSQKIDGVSVLSSKLKIEVNPATGQIVNVYSSMISDKNLQRPNIGAAEAIEIARYKAREAGLPDYPEHTKPTLSYIRTPRIDETEPVWSFTFGNHTITVNAANGNAKVQDW